jgi:hypothetical protein
MSRNKRREKKDPANRPAEKLPEVATPEATPPPDDASESHPVGCLTRLLWMLVGNLFLVVTTFVIYSTKGTFFSVADIVFWVIVALLLLVRYVDIRRFRGSTVTGAPATMKDFARYAWLLPLAALVIWAIAHVAGYLSH